jgi:hypothetical protein
VGVIRSKSDAGWQEHELCRPFLSPCRPSLMPDEDLDSHIKIWPPLQPSSFFAFASCGTESEVAHPVINKYVVIAAITLILVPNIRCVLTHLKLAHYCSNLKPTWPTEFAPCLAYRCCSKRSGKQGDRVTDEYLHKRRLELV